MKNHVYLRIRSQSNSREHSLTIGWGGGGVTGNGNVQLRTNCTELFSLSLLGIFMCNLLGYRDF